MVKGNNKYNIDEVITSKKISRPIFTMEERDLIVREEKKNIDRMLKQDFEELASSTLKTWLETTEAAEKAGPDSPLAKALEKIGKEDHIQSSQCLDRSLSIEVRRTIGSYLPFHLHQGCVRVHESPPYDFAGPPVESASVRTSFGVSD